MRYQCGISGAGRLRCAIWRDWRNLARIFMTGRSFFVALIATSSMLLSTGIFGQDVPGIEICTVEKTMERRTSCLQSNVDFLMKTITKLGAEQRQKIDTANRQIEGLKASLASLQKVVDDLQAAQKKPAEDANKKPDVPPAKDAAPAAKESAK